MVGIVNTLDRIRHIQALTWDEWREDGKMAIEFAPASDHWCWIISGTGYVIASPVNGKTVQLHCAALPHTPDVVATVHKVMGFLRNEGYERFIALIPSFCRSAQLAAHRAGFKRCGVIHRSVMRDGVLHDLIIREA